MSTVSAESRGNLHSPDIRRELARTINIVVMLQVLGLVVAFTFTEIVSSVYGQAAKYPWHVVFFVDLVFVMFGAILGQLVEGPSPELAPARPGTRPWALVSFVVALGTLSPLATQTAKIGRELAKGSGQFQEPTILSEIICAQHPESCGSIYFGVILSIAVLCCLVAVAAALSLRTSAGQQIRPLAAVGTTPDRLRVRNKPQQSAKAYFVFASSVFLLGAYTLFTQSWDVVGPGAVSDVEFRNLILGAVAALLLLTLMACGTFNSTVRATREVSAHVRASTAPVRPASRGEVRRPKDSPNTEQLLRAIMLPVVAWSTVLGAFLFSLPVLERYQFAEHQSVTEFIKALYVFIPLTAALLWSLVLLVVIYYLGAVAVRVLRYLIGLLSAVGKLARRGLRHLLTFVGALAGRMPKRVRVRPSWLGKWILPPSFTQEGAIIIPAVFVACLSVYGLYLGMFPLRPLAVSVGKLGLIPEGISAGKFGLRAEVSAFAKGGIPPLTFSRASIDCAVRPPTWHHSQADRFHVSARSCQFTNEAPCTATAIVVVGSASRDGSSAAKDAMLSRERGRLLAKVLQDNIQSRCGDGGNPRFYVLSLGRYLRGSLSSERQREAIALVGHGKITDAAFDVGLAELLRAESHFAHYSNCDLFAIGAKGEARWSRKLDCMPPAADR